MNAKPSKVFVPLMVLALAFHAQANLIDLGLRQAPGLTDLTSEAAWIMSDQQLSGAPLDLGRINLGVPPQDIWAPGSAFPLPCGFNLHYVNEPLQANVDWHSFQSAYPINFLLVAGGCPVTGTTWYHLYGVPFDQQFDGGGLIAIDGLKDISHVSFFGSSSQPVPEGGYTLALLACAIVGLGCARRVLRNA